MASAAAATSFAGRSALILPFVAATSALAAAGSPLYVAGSPIIALVHKFLKPDGEGAAERAAKVLSLALCWAYWCAGVAYLATRLVFGVGLSAWHACGVYLPLLLIAFKRDRNAPYAAWKRPVLKLMFDAPLVGTAYALRRITGLRLFAPFASVIDEDIVQGTLPFAPDVPELVDQYNVCAVVNMCAEWPGPKKAYSEFGVAQCRLPHQDTTAPDAESLRKGAAFIKERLEANPGKRVYVHCKGGIGRATTMSLAHYILNRGVPADEAIEKIQEKRSVVLASAADYGSIRELERATFA